MSLKGLAINFHFTRVCNFNCSFCFHTKKSSSMLPLKEQLSIIQQARDEGADKINFAGGEPFLFPERLGEMSKAAKQLGYQSVSIISNGSVVKKKWFDQYGKYIDILGISCDSIDPIVNMKHGRNFTGATVPVDLSKKILQLSQLSHDMRILFKINTVVTQLNKSETLSPYINQLKPQRWKVFQILKIENENAGNCEELLISQDEFRSYIERNRAALNEKSILVPEKSEEMQTSYIMIDHQGRFLDGSSGSYTPTRPIQEIGIKEAVRELGIGFNKEMFIKRGGQYQWSKDSIKH